MITAFRNQVSDLTSFAVKGLLAVKYQALSYFSISQGSDSKPKARPHKQSNLQVSMNTNTSPGTRDPMNRASRKTSHICWCSTREGALYFEALLASDETVKSLPLNF